MSLKPISHIPVWRRFDRVPVPDATAQVPDVVIVGAGPVGLTAALDLGRRGHRVVVLNKLDFIAAGSKAICFAKRTLDIWNRLGVAKAMIDKGVTWNVGKVFWGDSPEPIYQFDMLPIKQQEMPGFINLQQYHVETILVEAILALPNVELRWGHEVVGIEQDERCACLNVRVAKERYSLATGWVLACDGSRSPVREMMGLDFNGRMFEDNFLIADIKMNEPYPSERWFWFDPPFNPGRSALLHKQPDDVWRLDFQLGWDIDRAKCILPKNVEPLVRGMLGDGVPFEQVWYSVYTFQCRRMARFVHGRTVFAGDSAHLVSPFGARGCNGGIADADNLVWKLDLVLSGHACRDLMFSYEYEALITADENILNSSRSTDFMTPKTATSHAFRDAVLELAKDYTFARPFVNSGRLSTAGNFPESPLNTNDEFGDDWVGIAPGFVCLDAPVKDGWLLGMLAQGGFTLLTFGCAVESPCEVRCIAVESWADDGALIVDRFDLQPGSACLIRPDQYVAARWRHPTSEKVRVAFERAKGMPS